MATVKVKFRASSVATKEGTLFYQVIHKRIVRQIHTGYKLFPAEWDAVHSEVVLSYYTLMNHLIEKCTFFRSDGRCTEFYFYCCHTKLFLKINITKRKLIDIE